MDSPKITPMDNLLNILSGLSSGHEKALKQGIYNALALFLLCLVLSAGYGLYMVLSPFLKPLIWALLCGSALFPFKYSLTTLVQEWFLDTEKSHRPLLISISMVPVNIFENISNNIGFFFQKYLKYIASLFFSLFAVMTIYQYTPRILYSLIYSLSIFFKQILGYLIMACNTYVVTAILTAYLSTVYLYWTPNNSKRYHLRSYGLWFIISLYFSNLLNYSVIAFCSLQLFYFIGFIYEFIFILEQHVNEGKQMSFIESLKYALLNIHIPSENLTNMSIIEEETPSEEKEIQNVNINASVPRQKPMLKNVGKSLSMNLDLKKPLQDTSNRRTRSTSSIMSGRISISDHYLLNKLKSEFRMSLDLEDNNVDTDKYMFGAMYACIGMMLWKNLWILFILIIPITYYLLKLLNSYFTFWELLKNKLDVLVESIYYWCQERQDALVPIHVKGLYKVFIIVDNKMTQILKGSVDAVTTTAVILTLVIFVICGTIFITIQIYTEGVHLIQVSGEILNATLINNADIDWVPQQWEDSVNSVLDNAYTYGRAAISDGIRKFVKDLEPLKAEQLEKKVLELWDRLYQSYMMSNSKSDMIGPSVDVNAAYSVWESLLDSFGKSYFQIFNMSSIQNFVKENIGILKSVLDSVWSIVKGNMTVILSFTTELLYIVLMSGSAVLNFVFSLVVFFTALFYLLSSSGKNYKPIELITNFSPIICHRFAMTLQESVVGVFTATFKLASFFGMWTWFMHNLFQVKIVYIPTVLATLLGAIPFLDAYFACFPAAIELWFTQGPLIAIIFFFFHFLPCNIVVTEFYKEIKGGGHPYLTGLSIAGGVLCLGMEGAIFGPLLLCCIMVAINLSRRYLQGPSEETINNLKSQISKFE